MLIEVDSTGAPLYVSGRDRRLRVMARMPWWRLVVAAIPAAVAAAVAWSSRGPLLAVTAAALLLLPVALGAWLWQRIDTVNTAQPVPRRWTITEDEIRVSAPDATRTWRWAAVVAVATSPDAYLMRQESGIILDLPRDAMTDSQQGELQRFLTDRGLLP